MIRAALALAIALSGGGAVAYRAGPPPAHTGAFGEPDCGECHFDAIRDDGTGQLVIHAPHGYESGRAYDVVVKLRHPDLAAAGFQLTTRFLDGPDAGTQAGTLEPASDRTRLEPGENGVAYASQSATGVAAESPGRTRWTLRWTAPARGGAVAFDVAAQVANDDDSEFGERLYRARHIARRASYNRCGSGPDPDQRNDTLRLSSAFEPFVAIFRC